MTIIGCVSGVPAARPTDDTIRLAATVAIRLAGALTVFAGLILTTRALIAASSMITMIYWQRTELLSNVERSPTRPQVPVQSPLRRSGRFPANSNSMRRSTTCCGPPMPG